MKNNVLVKDFVYKGHRCFIAFNNIGAHCGYVEIKLKNSSIEESVLENLSVHGGVSYDEPYLRIGEREYKEKNCWYIGFDCAHSSDVRDFDKAVSYGLMTQDVADMNKSNFSYLLKWGTFRDVDYVESEIKVLVDQIEKLF